jgi:hypothetical protein
MEHLRSANSIDEPHPNDALFLNQDLNKYMNMVNCVNGLSMSIQSLCHVNLRQAGTAGAYFHSLIDSHYTGQPFPFVNENGRQVDQRSELNSIGITFIVRELISRKARFCVTVINDQLPQWSVVDITDVELIENPGFPIIMIPSDRPINIWENLQENRQQMLPVYRVPEDQPMQIAQAIPAGGDYPSIPIYETREQTIKRSVRKALHDYRKTEAYQTNADAKASKAAMTDIRETESYFAKRIYKEEMQKKNASQKTRQGREELYSTPSNTNDCIEQNKQIRLQNNQIYEQNKQVNELNKRLRDAKDSISVEQAVRGTRRKTSNIISSERYSNPPLLSMDVQPPGYLVPVPYNNINRYNYQHVLEVPSDQHILSRSQDHHILSRVNPEETQQQSNNMRYISHVIDQSGMTPTELTTFLNKPREHVETPRANSVQPQQFQNYYENRTAYRGQEPSAESAASTPTPSMILADEYRRHVNEMESRNRVTTDHHHGAQEYIGYTVPLYTPPDRTEYTNMCPPNPDMQHLRECQRCFNTFLQTRRE